MVHPLLDETEHRLSGVWKVHEDTLSHNIWLILGIFEEHSDTLISFDPDEFGDEVHIMTVDTVTFIINEPRTDPSKDWWDVKSNSAGEQATSMNIRLSALKLNIKFLR